MEAEALHRPRDVWRVVNDGRRARMGVRHRIQVGLAVSLPSHHMVDRCVPPVCAAPATYGEQAPRDAAHD